MNPKLKVIFFVDAEADYYYNVPSPHFSKTDLVKYKLNKIAGKLYKYPQPSSVGLVNIIDCCKKYKQPATLCITGHLYLKSCKGFPHFNEKKPQNTWYHDKVGKDWYYWDTGGDSKSHPGLFLGNIIEKEKDNPLFVFGLHAFTHEALTLESKDVVESIIEAGIKSAQSVGITPTAFACPFEMTQDLKDPQKIPSILKKYGFKRLFHAGYDSGLKIQRFFSVQKPSQDNGLEKIWISNYFEGTSNKKHINNILTDILRNKDKEVVYCLGTHDFTHKNTQNMERIFQFLKENGFSGAFPEK